MSAEEAQAAARRRPADEAPRRIQPGVLDTPDLRAATAYDGERFTLSWQDAGGPVPAVLTTRGTLPAITEQALARSGV